MAYQIDLTGKVALVTGASSGLGRQFACTLASAGAKVILAARRLDKLQDLQNQMQANGQEAIVVPLDVTDQKSIETAVSMAYEQAGEVDILVNNSGVSKTQKILDVQPEDFDYTFGANTKGAFFVAQAIGRRMLLRAKAAQDSNQVLPQQRIIQVASITGLQAIAQISVYCMSKAAVVQMTKAMALEWGRYGINVNAICPGYIETEMTAAHWQTEAGQKLIQKLPRKRVGQTQDLEGLLMLLASDQSSFMNGSILVADDGFLVQ
ncbi:MAG: SDR family oxidoreductase [Polynucleobacter sp.]|jgi:NAD(P)-dependent dehydrogenase (short-subunit alcohol dehydrogenase family)|nr:SDR family oxidoreductase [Polynucleobacter sp.]